MNLLVDIGNSRLKWATFGDGEIGDMAALDYRQSGFIRQLAGAWQALPAPDSLAIAAVSAKSVSASVTNLAETLWPGVKIVLPQASAQAFGVSNAYQQPEKLGIDRWLALIGAYHAYSGKLCVVDCGTAITIDVLQADGRHLGGLIAPGLNLMQKALVAETADLTFSAQNQQLVLANETHAAIANGVLMAAAGLIENAVRELAPRSRLILTGGDAELLAEFLSLAPALDRALVLKGLAVFCMEVAVS